LNEQELAETEAAIREILISAGLQWILDDVDEALSAGIWTDKPVVVRHQSRQTPTGEEKFDFYEPAIPGVKGRQRNITTNIPHTRLQRVELLISALRRAIIELPAIQEDTLKNLNLQEDAGEQGHIMPADTVSFLPEDGTSSPASPPQISDILTREATLRRDSTVRVITTLLEEIAQ
jgi:hypothetical protein